MADRELKIDYEIKRICNTRSVMDYLVLEKNILLNGCNEPIYAWNGNIIDGFDEYEICLNHGLPFYISEKDFDCREAAIAWICSRKLKSENLTEENRKFLIGAQYAYERIANSKRRKRGVTQYTTNDSPESMVTYQMEENISGTIGSENNVSAGTVRKYASYARALLALDHKDPQLFKKILSGEYKISHDNIVSLSKMNEQEVKRFHRKINSGSNIYYKKTRKMFSSKPKIDSKALKEKPASIKDMPKYDPDAEVVGLTLTIPSWTSSIKRVLNKTDFRVVSVKAKDDLERVLFDLEYTIEEIETKMEER